MDDGLPQRVCTSCVERVRSCCEILDSFKAADARLRQMVELCNFGETNIVRDGTITLQGESGLPIILQTVTEDPQEELVKKLKAWQATSCKLSSCIKKCLTFFFPPFFLGGHR